MSLLLAILFAIADRFAGGDYAKRLHIPIRAVAVSVLALMVVLAIGHPKWALVALAWGAWRWPGWRMVPGAKIDPRTPAELKGYFLRHLFALALVPVALLLGWGFLAPLAAMVAFAVVATLLGRVLAFYADRGRDVNVYVELARGATYGLLLGMVMR